MSELTRLQLSNILSYDGDTGQFTWKVSEGKSNRKVGDVVGSYDDAGYVVITLRGRKYKAHRLVYLYVYGGLPEGDIDHMNGNKSDNRLCNLRSVSKSVNQQNQTKPQIKNSSGYLGVSLHARSGKWVARIKVGNRRVYLGIYTSPEDASAAYLLAKRKHHEGNLL